jgi:hypothetical protein
MTFQAGGASFDDTPDDFNVNAEVLVDQDVSVGGDAPPGNLWRPVAGDPPTDF